MSECAEYLMALTEDSSDVLPEKQKELVLRRDESTRVEVKIGPASLNSLYHAQTPRAMIRTYMTFPRRLAVVSEVVGPDCYVQMIFIFYRSEREGQFVASGFMVFQQNLCDQHRQSDRGIVDYKWLVWDNANAENSCL